MAKDETAELALEEAELGEEVVQRTRVVGRPCRCITRWRRMVVSVGLGGRKVGGAKIRYGPDRFPTPFFVFFFC